MRRLTVFNSITLDGYFTGPNGDLRWAHSGPPDPEFDAYVAGNASGDGQLLFGRITYEMMAAHWPTAEASRDTPEVAEGMNALPKVVFSRMLEKASWSNTTVVKGDLAAAVRRMKAESGPDMTILGSGSIVKQLAEARLVDEYQLVVHPVVLGAGRTMFEGLATPLAL
ncbi:MAG: dihydrofolate reductase family protein, partial [Gemmatimonadales bacterium]